MYRYRCIQDIVNIVRLNIFKPFHKTSVSKRFYLPLVYKINNFKIVKSGAETSYKKSFKGKYGPKTFYLLGFLGFFEQEEDEDEEPTEESILMTIKRAVLAIQRDQIPKAEMYLNKAFRMSDEVKMEDVKTQIIDIQANLCLQMRDWPRAENLFKLVAQRMISNGNAITTDNAIVEISIKLAEIYKNLARYDDAETGYQYCVGVQRQKIEKEGVVDEDTLLLAAWALHGLAQLYLSINTVGNFSRTRIEESMDLIKSAHKYATDAVGSDSHQALAIQSDIATTLSLLGDFDKALTTLQECSAVAKDKEYEELYTTLQINTGTVFLQKGELDEAEKVCREAKIIAERVNDPECTERADNCVKKAKELRKKMEAESAKRKD